MAVNCGEPRDPQRMNPFVDAQKRGICLPNGLKDLAEVIEKGNRTVDSKAAFKLVISLAEAERYLAGLLLTPNRISYLAITLPSQHHLQLAQVHNELCVLMSIDGSDKGRLPRVRRLFEEAGIAAVVDVIGSFIGAGSRILIYPLPVVAPDAAELVTRVMHDGFALPEESQLYFTSNELTVA